MLAMRMAMALGVELKDLVARTIGTRMMPAARAPAAPVSNARAQALPFVYAHHAFGVAWTKRLVVEAAVDWDGVREGHESPQNDVFAGSRDGRGRGLNASPGDCSVAG